MDAITTATTTDAHTDDSKDFEAPKTVERGTKHERAEASAGAAAGAVAKKPRKPSPRIKIATVEDLSKHEMTWMQGYVPYTFDEVYDAIESSLPEEPQKRRWGQLEFPGSTKYVAFQNRNVLKDLPAYCFSGISLQPKPAPDLVLKLFRVASKLAGINYTFCLCNFYMCRDDLPLPKLSGHFDDELMIRGGNLVSISFTRGVSRRFFVHLTPRSKDPENKVIVPLENGDLLIAKLGEHYHGLLPPLAKDLRLGVRANEQIVFTFRQNAAPME